MDVNLHVVYRFMKDNEHEVEQLAGGTLPIQLQALVTIAIDSVLHGFMLLLLTDAFVLKHIH